MVSPSSPSTRASSTCIAVHLALSSLLCSAVLCVGRGPWRVSLPVPASPKGPICAAPTRTDHAGLPSLLVLSPALPGPHPDGHCALCWDSQLLRSRRRVACALASIRTANTAHRTRSPGSQAVGNIGLPPSPNSVLAISVCMGLQTTYASASREGERSYSAGMVTPTTAHGSGQGTKPHTTTTRFCTTTREEGQLVTRTVRPPRQPAHRLHAIICAEPGISHRLRGRDRFPIFAQIVTQRRQLWRRRARAD